MTDFVNIHFDVRSMQRDIKALPKIVRQVAAGTLNKVGRKANTAIKKHITSHYNIKARELKIGNIIRLFRADARKPNPKFTISVRKIAKDLREFDAKQLRPRGVSVKVTKTRKTIRGAFMAITRAGDEPGELSFAWKRFGKGIRKVERTTPKGYTYMAVRRRTLYGPSFAKLYGSKKSRRVANKVVQLNFVPIFDADFRKKMAKRRK